jgi:hypothetical protein
MKEILSVDEHLREMENLRIELREKMSKEYMKGFRTGALLVLGLVLLVGGLLWENLT